MGAPDRPRPPGAVGFDLDVLTEDGLADQAEIAGLEILATGPEDAPREGKASSEDVSTLVLEEEPLVFELDFLAVGDGALPREGKGSGAPSSPCRYDISEVEIQINTVRLRMTPQAILQRMNPLFVVQQQRKPSCLPRETKPRCNRIPFDEMYRTVD